jgi:hypothetical protein
MDLRFSDFRISDFRFSCSDHLPPKNLPYRSFMISCPREQRLHRTRTTANAAATHFIHGYEMSSSGPSTVRGTKLREVYCGVIVRTMYVAAPIEAAHGASQGRILTQGFWQLHHRSRHWYAPAWELEQWRWRHLAHVNSANVRAGNCGLLLWAWRQGGWEFLMEGPFWSRRRSTRWTTDQVRWRCRCRLKYLLILVDWVD